MITARPTLEVAFTNGPYDNSPTYVDLSQLLRDESDITFSRGKQGELQSYDAGDLACILDPALIGASRRALEPMYTGGLYYPNIQPEKRVRYSLEYPWLPGQITDSLGQQAVSAVYGIGNGTGYLDFGSPASLQLTTFSLEVWFQVDPTQPAGDDYHMIFGRYTQDPTLFYRSATKSLNLYGGPGGIVTSPVVADGKWHHAIATVQGGVTSGSVLYLDGVQIGGVSTLNAGGTAHWAALTDNAAEALRGMVRGLRIYNRILTPAEVVTRYQGREVSDYGTSVKLDVPCNEGTGNPADISGNGNNGTFGGAGTYWNVGAAPLVSNPQVWQSDANTNLSMDATRHYLLSGQGNPLGKSMILTAVGAGGMKAYSPYLPVTAGQWVGGSFRYLYVSGGAGRTIDTQIEFYDSTYTLIGTAYDSVLKVDSSTAWTRVGHARVAPASSAYVRFIANVQGASAGEKHAICCPALEYATNEGVFPQIVVFADDWDPVWPGGMDAYTHLTGHDGFKLLGGKNVTGLGYETLVKSFTPTKYFRLGDPLYSPYAFDEMNPTSPAIVEGSVVFDMPGAILADVDTAAEFGNGILDLGSGFSWVGTGAETWSFIYKVPSAAWGGFFIDQGPIDFVGATNDYCRVGMGSDNSVAPFTYTYQLIFEAKISGTTWYFTANIPNDDNWHQVMVTKGTDGKTVKVYVDGALVPVRSDLLVLGGTVVSGNFVGTAALNFTSQRVLLTGGGGDTHTTLAQMDEVFFVHGTALTLTNHQDMNNLKGNAWSAQTSGQRINAVLDAIGWPAADRNIDTGVQTMPAQTDSLAQTNTKQYLQLVEQSEGGELFMAKNGSVRFIGRQTRYKPPYSTVQAVFGDRPGTVDSATGLTELPYGDTHPTFGDGMLYTEAEVTRAVPGGGSAQTQFANDPTLANNPQRTLSRSGLLLPDDATAYNYAKWLFNFFRIALIRFDAITVDPTNNDSVWAQILLREIGDRIVIVRRPPGWQVGQPTMRAECFILGISGNDRRNKSTRTFQLGQVPATPMLILDDAVLGKLDSNNYVGF